jgi:hypothetical protein
MDVFLLSAQGLRAFVAIFAYFMVSERREFPFTLQKQMRFAFIFSLFSLGMRRFCFSSRLQLRDVFPPPVVFYMYDPLREILPDFVPVFFLSTQLKPVGKILQVNANSVLCLALLVISY